MPIDIRHPLDVDRQRVEGLVRMDKRKVLIGRHLGLVIYHSYHVQPRAYISSITLCRIVTKVQGIRTRQMHVQNEASSSACRPLRPSLAFNSHMMRGLSADRKSRNRCASTSSIRNRSNTMKPISSSNGGLQRKTFDHQCKSLPEIHLGETQR